MPLITFKAKPIDVYNADDTFAFRQVKVASIGTQHCDMAAFRCSKAFGGYANSQLFPAMLKRALRDNGVGATLRLDQLPACVTVDDSGFLAVVTIDLPDAR